MTDAQFGVTELRTLGVAGRGAAFQKLLNRISERLCGAGVLGFERVDGFDGCEMLAHIPWKRDVRPPSMPLPGPFRALLGSLPSDGVGDARTAVFDVLQVEGDIEKDADRRSVPVVGFRDDYRRAGNHQASRQTGR